MLRTSDGKPRGERFASFVARRVPSKWVEGIGLCSLCAGIPGPAVAQFGPRKDALLERDVILRSKLAGPASVNITADSDDVRVVVIAELVDPPALN